MRISDAGTLARTEGGIAFPPSIPLHHGRHRIHGKPPVPESRYCTRSRTKRRPWVRGACRVSLRFTQSMPKAYGKAVCNYRGIVTLFRKGVFPFMS